AARPDGNKVDGNMVDAEARDAALSKPDGFGPGVSPLPTAGFVATVALTATSAAPLGSNLTVPASMTFSLFLRTDPQRLYLIASGINGQSDAAPLFPRPGNWSSESFSVEAIADQSNCNAKLTYQFKTVDLVWTTEGLTGTMTGSLNCIGV